MHNRLITESINLNSLFNSCKKKKLEPVYFVFMIPMIRGHVILCLVFLLAFTSMVVLIMIIA